jgi:hypothetical protein
MTREQCIALAETVQSGHANAPLLSVEVDKWGRDYNMKVYLDGKMVAGVAATSWKLVLVMFKAWAHNYRFKYPVHLTDLP